MRSALGNSVALSFKDACYIVSVNFRRGRSYALLALAASALCLRVHANGPVRAGADSVLIDALNDSAFKLMSRDPAEGLRIAEEARQRSREASWPLGEARSLLSMGQNLSALSRYQEAAHRLNESLSMAQQLGDPRLEMKVRIALGLHCSRDHDYPRALENYQLAEALADRSNDRALKAASVGNMAAVYHNLKLYPEALERYRTALVLNRTLGNDRSAALNLGNIGMVHFDQGGLDSALTCFTEALVLNRKVNNRTAIGQALTNMGRVHTRLRSFSEATSAFAEALTIFTQLGDRYRIGWVRVEQGRLLNALGDHPGAARACEEALRIADEVHKLKERYEACTCLAEAYKGSGASLLAMKYMEQATLARDSLERSEGRQEVGRLTLKHALEQQHLKDSLEQVATTRVATLQHEAEIASQKAQKRLFLLGGIGVLLLAAGLWNRLRFMRRSRASLALEKDRSEELLLNILPRDVADELKAKGRSEARHIEQVTVLFTDFKGFTEASERLSASALVAEVDACFQAFDGIMERFGVEKIKTIGDAYMAAGGLRQATGGSATDVVRAGLAMQTFLIQRKLHHDQRGTTCFDMRVGIHTGPVVAGIVGVKKFQYDIWGDTVNTASRMESSGEVGHVNISESTHALVKDEPEFTFTTRGKVLAKGKGELHMFFVHLQAIPTT